MSSTANPLSCAAAAAVLEYIVKENVVDNALAKGLYLGEKLKEALGDSPIVGDIRVIVLSQFSSYQTVPRTPHVADRWLLSFAGCGNVLGR